MTGRALADYTPEQIILEAQRIVYSSDPSRPSLPPRPTPGPACDGERWTAIIAGGAITLTLLLACMWMMLVAAGWAVWQAIR